MEEKRDGQHPARPITESDTKSAARTTPLASPETEPAPTEAERDHIRTARKRAAAEDLDTPAGSDAA